MLLHFQCVCHVSCFLRSLCCDPIIGLNLPESIIMAITPSIALFNATEPLYVIPLGYFIARTVGKNLKVGNKI